MPAKEAWARVICSLASSRRGSRGHVLNCSDDEDRHACRQRQRPQAEADLKLELKPARPPHKQARDHAEASRERPLSFTMPLDESPPPPRWRKRLLLVIGGAGICIAASLSLLVGHQRRIRHSRHHGEGDGYMTPAHGPAGGQGGDAPPRIPLSRVVRWKEKQWIDEDLHLAGGGDANAMIRLAKHYLYGAGAEVDVKAAQQWLRTAKMHGINCHIDELRAEEPSISNTNPNRKPQLMRAAAEEPSSANMGRRTQPPPNVNHRPQM